MPAFEVWCEGHWAQGNEEFPTPAKLMGTFEADSFREACLKWYRTLEDDYSRECFNAEALTFWSCRLFDNEADARRAHG